MSAPQNFQWTDAFLLGYGPMDDTHREFVDVVNGLLQCADDELGWHLQAFIAHAEHHFGEEDTWMRDNDFPAADCHIKEHAAVMRSAHEVAAAVQTGNFAYARAFAAELVRWFPGHADYLDSALAQWMAKRKYGGVPVVLKSKASLEQGFAQS
ncbi:MAG: hemerythrin domain-containing protein [Thauera sp.]|jgi:hemerythrin|nr:hemerythrin domain-containing protein [Thauera sp.]